MENEHERAKGDIKESATKNMKLPFHSKHCTEEEEDNYDSLFDEAFSTQNNNPESIAKLYPHLYSTILQGQTSLLRENANQSLAALFPSVLTAEGPKSKNDLVTSELVSYAKNATSLDQTSYSSTTVSESVAAELSLALSSALSLSKYDVTQNHSVSLPYKDSTPRSETVISQNVSKAKEGYLSDNRQSTLQSGTIHSQNSIAPKKRKHQPPSSESCTSTIQASNVNVTSPIHSSYETTSSLTDGIRPEIGPPTLGDALQQKIRETQAKIKSNVISASSSQSLLPPGKCNSHHNHQTGSKELNQLLHQHYCGKKAPKAPSASAIRKGKVPPPPGSNVSPQSAKSSSGSESAMEANLPTDKRNKQTEAHPDDCLRYVVIFTLITCFSMFEP